MAYPVEPSVAAQDGPAAAVKVETSAVRRRWKNPDATS